MNILIVNMHSALNLGDDGIFRVTLDALREKYPSAKITIAANDPQSWHKYKDIEILPSLCTWVADCRLGKWRRRAYLMPLGFGLLVVSALLYRAFKIRILAGTDPQKKLQSAYFNADLILSCGGGYFYAHRPLSPALIWNLLILSYGTWLGKKVILLPQSIGPIRGGMQRFIARQVFRHVSRIMARETETVNFLRNTLRLPTDPILLPDLAFGLPAPPPALPALPPGEDPALRVGVTILDRGAQDPTFKQQTHYEESLAWLLTELQRRFGAHIYVFVQCYGPSADQNDLHAARRLVEYVRRASSQVTLLAEFTSCMDIKAFYGSMDLVLGTRMHSCIYALSCLVPVFLIGYQPKALGMMKAFGLQKFCRPIEGLDRQDLLELVSEVIHQRETLRDRVAKQYAQTASLLHHWSRYLGD
jgi:colanic acid/amylovoran biosynthesis protein